MNKQYFCDLPGHDDYYYNSVTFDSQMCENCNHSHEFNYKLACKKCQSTRKINYIHVLDKIKEYEESFKSSVKQFKACVKLAEAHIQDETTFYQEAGFINIDHDSEQIIQLQKRLTNLEQRMRFVLELMEVEGVRHLNDEEEGYERFKSEQPGPHYIQVFLKILQEITHLNCDLARFEDSIKSFEDTFMQHEYIKKICSQKALGNNILYTIAPIVRCYIGDIIRNEKKRQGRGIETDEQAGKSEGKWYNDQLVSGIRIIKQNQIERYYKGNWLLEGQRATPQEWDKDRQFQKGIKKITYSENKVITYLGQWNYGQFVQGIIIINDNITEILAGTWQYNGQNINGDFDGLKLISDRQSLTSYDGQWREEKFTGIKELTQKVNNHKMQTKYTNGQPEEAAVVQNPLSEWIFEGTLTADGKFKQGKLYHRTTQNNFYNGTFQGENQKHIGEEFVNNQLRYKGTYKNDKYHGEGILFQSDGATYYKGQFVNGEMHGLGQRFKATKNYDSKEYDKALGSEQYYEKGAPEELCPLF